MIRMTSMTFVEWRRHTPGASLGWWSERFFFRSLWIWLRASEQNYWQREEETLCRKWRFGRKWEMLCYNSSWKAKNSARMLIVFFFFFFSSQFAKFLQSLSSLLWALLASCYFSTNFSTYWALNVFSRQIEELKESYQEKLENTFEMYKDAIKEHAYQCARNNLEDDYMEEFIAEQEKVEVCSFIGC